MFTIHPVHSFILERRRDGDGLENLHFKSLKFLTNHSIYRYQRQRILKSLGLVWN